MTGNQSHDNLTVALKHEWVTPSPSTKPGFTFHDESPVQVWEGGKRGSTLDVTLLDRLPVPMDSAGKGLG